MSNENGRAVIMDVMIDFVLIQWVNKHFDEHYEKKYSEFIKIHYHCVDLASLIERMHVIQVQNFSSNHHHSKEECGDRSLSARLKSKSSVGHSSHQYKIFC